MNIINDTQSAEEYFAIKNLFTTGPVEVNRMLERGDDVAVIDVRASEDFRKGHVPGAINLPEEQWDAAEVLSRDRLNILYCYTQTCHLASRGAQFFAQQGYPVMEMEGGFEAWKSARFESEKSRSEPKPWENAKHAGTHTTRRLK